MMVPTDNTEMTLDPVEMLNRILERAWRTMCCTYDAEGCLPDTKTLFAGADLSRPFPAAKQVLTNMLLSVMESIGRFSPWYTRPARAFGINSIRDPATGRSNWMLAPESILRWQITLDQLSDAIQQNYGLIDALILVDGLMDEHPDDDPIVTACCGCIPPRTIQLTRSVLIKAEIMCHACLQPFE
jgi:hypothetical protein